jgi:hypothetical protein
VAALLPPGATDAEVYAEGARWMARAGNGRTALAAIRGDRAAPPRFGSLTDGLAAATAPTVSVTLPDPTPPVVDGIHPGGGRFHLAAAGRSVRPRARQESERRLSPRRRRRARRGGYGRRPCLAGTAWRHHGTPRPRHRGAAGAAPPRVSHEGPRGGGRAGVGDGATACRYHGGARRCGPERARARAAFGSAVTAGEIRSSACRTRKDEREGRAAALDRRRPGPGQPGPRGRGAGRRSSSRTLPDTRLRRPARDHARRRVAGDVFADAPGLAAARATALAQSAGRAPRGAVVRRKAPQLDAAPAWRAGARGRAGRGHVDRRHPVRRVPTLVVVALTTPWGPMQARVPHHGAERPLGPDGSPRRRSSSCAPTARSRLRRLPRDASRSW